MPRKRTKARGRERKSIPAGRAYIQSTFNNTIVTLTDPQGNVVAWGSSGSAGFKGSRKGTPYAAQLAAIGVSGIVITYRLEGNKRKPMLVPGAVLVKR